MSKDWILSDQVIVTSDEIVCGVLSGDGWSSDRVIEWLSDRVMSDWVIEWLSDWVMGFRMRLISNLIYDKYRIYLYHIFNVLRNLLKLFVHRCAPHNQHFSDFSDFSDFSKTSITNFEINSQCRIVTKKGSPLGNPLFSIKRQFLIENWKLRIENWKLKIENWKLKITSPFDVSWNRLTTKMWKTFLKFVKWDQKSEKFFQKISKESRFPV